MSTLQSEWNRLYRAAALGMEPSAGDATGLLTPDGCVRALVLELARPADWDVLSSVWRGVQTDLGLPAPAIAVSGVDAYQLWFSLAESVPAAQGQTFLEFLRTYYLGAVAPERVGLLPTEDQSSAVAMRHADRVPAVQPASGRWSAFVAPDLAGVFSDEPWLDRPPSEEAQASVLSRLQVIKAEVFQALMKKIKPAIPLETADVTASDAAKAVPRAKLVPGKDVDPRQFLQDVLNDETLALPLRIEAAKALLHQTRGGTSAAEASRF